MPRLNFIPERDGWHFANTFTNRILPGVLFNVSTSGLCGGMVMTALDYWRAGIPIPAHEPADLPQDANGTRLPDEASALRRYIYDRQINSLLTNFMFTRWVVAPTITPTDFHSWAIGSEFNVVRQQLGAGRPTMLGLWSMTPGDLTGGHQVLCYGWDENPIRLYIYDPNRPDEESVLTPLSPNEGCRVTGQRTGTNTFYRGYFFTDVYDWNQPANPPYRDLTLTAGLNLSPAGPDVNVGAPLQLSATVQNVGEYPSRFRAFVIWARDPGGRNIDAAVGGIEPGFTSLNPGQSRTIARNVPAFGQLAGVHTIGVSRESLRGHWQDIPATAAGTAARRQLRLWPVKVKQPDVWVDVPEAARGDLDTGITLRPGDEFAVTGTGAIWSGVWFTGLNGPEGWDRLESNPAFPLHSTSDSRPFSLIGRLEGEPYFFVGRGLTRRPFERTGPRRLFLRVNDNTPANGSGAFRALVEVWR